MPKWNQASPYQHTLARMLAERAAKAGLTYTIINGYEVDATASQIVQNLAAWTIAVEGAEAGVERDKVQASWDARDRLNHDVQVEVDAIREQVVDQVHGKAIKENEAFDRGYRAAGFEQATDPSVSVLTGPLDPPSPVSTVVVLDTLGLAKIVNTIAAVQRDLDMCLKGAHEDKWGNDQHLAIERAETALAEILPMLGLAPSAVAYGEDDEDLSEPATHGTSRSESAGQ